jgi:alkanesulfonate monooxygenase SsuD/methylene tetrahydromethanopterin reductase-like flavin-dependent oxidoreductase (luciferase family)
VAPTFQLLAHEDPGQVLPMAKFGIAMYYGQDNSPYARAAAALGYAEDVAEIQAAYREGGAERASAAVSDRLAQSISIVGTQSECRSRVDQLLTEGADRLFVTLPAPTRTECEPLLSGIIPDRFR